MHINCADWNYLNTNDLESLHRFMENVHLGFLLDSDGKGVPNPTVTVEDVNHDVVTAGGCSHLVSTR